MACVSVHGANRLGGNSLLDLVVFGRAAGLHLEKALTDGIEYDDATDADIEAALARLTALNERTEGEDVATLRRELQSCMQNYFGVFRTGEYMQKGIAQLADLRGRIANVKINDKSAGVQHCSYRSSGTAEPAGSGRSHRHRCRDPQRVPRRSRP